MIYILFGVVLAIAIVDYIILRKDILSPSLWAAIMFLVSIIVNIINVDRWESDFSIKAMVIIAIGLISISLGEIIVRFFCNWEYYNNYNEKTKYRPIKVKQAKFFFLIIVQLVVLALNYNSITSLVGAHSDNVLRSARNLYGGGAGGSIVLRMTEFSKAIAYMFIYLIIYNKIICRTKINKWYVFPILIYFINGILSTGRTVFIRLIVYTFFLFTLFYVKTHGNKLKQLNKIFCIGILALFCFFIIFTAVGKLLEKGIYNTAIDVFQIYTGSSIYLFNQYIENPPKTTNSLFGEHTLYGIRNILSYIIPSVTHTSDPSLEFRYIPHWYSNIYTAFRRYHQDFGILGVIIICLMLGMFYSKLRINAGQDSQCGWKSIFYAWSIYPIIEIAIEERFFMNYISASSLFSLIIFLMVYYFVLKVNIVLHR